MSGARTIYILFNSLLVWVSRSTYCFNLCYNFHHSFPPPLPHTFFTILFFSVVQMWAKHLSCPSCIVLSIGGARSLYSSSMLLNLLSFLFVVFHVQQHNFNIDLATFVTSSASTPLGIPFFVRP